MIQIPLSQLQLIVREVWEGGAVASEMRACPTVVREFSGLPGFRLGGAKVDLWESDFGNIQVIESDEVPADEVWFGHEGEVLKIVKVKA